MLPLHLFDFIVHARWFSLQSTRYIFLCFDMNKQLVHYDLGDVNGMSNSVMYLTLLSLLIGSDVLLPIKEEADFIINIFQICDI